MIRATELGGRAVVDVDAAEKLGKIERVVLDPDSRRVAGFVVSRGSSLFNAGDSIHLAARCVHAIGPDAITVHRDVGERLAADDVLEGLPRVSDMVGRKVVSDQGRLLGTVDDVLIDERDGRILGYALTGDGADDKLKNLLPGKAQEHDRRGSYLKADANLRAGKDLIVAPEDAVSSDWERLETRSAATDFASPLSGAATPAPAVSEPQWAAPAQIRTDASPWVRTDDGRTEQLNREGRER